MISTFKNAAQYFATWNSINNSIQFSSATWNSINARFTMRMRFTLKSVYPTWLASCELQFRAPVDAVHCHCDTEIELHISMCHI